MTSYPTILAQKNQQKKQHKNQKQTLTHAYKKAKKKSRINNAKKYAKLRFINLKRKIHYPFKWFQLNGNVKIGHLIHLIVEKLDVFNFHPICFFYYN